MNYIGKVLGVLTMSAMPAATQAPEPGIYKLNNEACVLSFPGYESLKCTTTIDKGISVTRGSTNGKLSFVEINTKGGEQYLMVLPADMYDILQGQKEDMSGFIKGESPEYVEEKKTLMKTAARVVRKENKEIQ